MTVRNDLVANFELQQLMRGQRAQYATPPRRFDAVDYQNLMENVRHGSIPDWQKRDVADMMRQLRGAPPCIDANLNDLLMRRLATGVETARCSPRQQNFGWVRHHHHHHREFNRCPAWRTAEFADSSNSLKRIGKFALAAVIAGGIIGGLSRV